MEPNFHIYIFGKIDLKLYYNTSTSSPVLSTPRRRAQWPMQNVIVPLAIKVVGGALWCHSLVGRRHMDTRCVPYGWKRMAEQAKRSKIFAVAGIVEVLRQVEIREQKHKEKTKKRSCWVRPWILAHELPEHNTAYKLQLQLEKVR